MIVEIDTNTSRQQSPAYDRQFDDDFDRRWELAEQKVPQVRMNQESADPPAAAGLTEIHENTFVSNEKF